MAIDGNPSTIWHSAWSEVPTPAGFPHHITLDLGFMYHVPLAALVTRFGGDRRAKLGIGRYRREDLNLVKELIEAGKYRPVIDRVYALNDVVDATRYVETGQKTGNVVLRVNKEASSDGGSEEAEPS
jgi:NADPH:quinone reductase-like Zn-dependent oxidoreductase